jgi:hypothetical protein
MSLSDLVICFDRCATEDNIRWSDRPPPLLSSSSKW